MSDSHTIDFESVEVKSCNQSRFDEQANTQHYYRNYTTDHSSTTGSCLVLRTIRINHTDQCTLPTAGLQVAIAHWNRGCGQKNGFFR